MKLTIVVLYAFLHGSTADKPFRIDAFTRGDVCARAAQVAQRELRKRYGLAEAITFCRRSAAPVSSPRPVSAPVLEASR